MSDFDAILARLPSLQDLLDTHGSMSIFEYAKNHYQIPSNTSPLGVSRKRELLDFLDEYVTRKFGKISAEIVIDTLSRNYAVSTAEHHGPMGHPFFFQSALLRAITQPELPVINFATSHVSLGNSSYPRGLVFHGDGEKAPKEYLHLPFFGSKSRMCPVFRLPAYSREDIEKNCIKRLSQYHKDSYISEESYQKILHFLTVSVLDETILALPTYSEQITRLNQIWWHSLFPELPPYISLDVEDIVVELLQEHLQTNTVMAQLLTEITLQVSIEAEFDGISCCFDLSNHSGTYLFWYLDEHHKRHALWREGDELVSQDTGFRINMTPEAYRYHLEQRHLIPSGLLVYNMFACYYGVTCFGGIFQGDYLPQVKKAFENIFSSSAGMGDIQTDIINADLYYMLREDDEPITALDFIINPLQSSFLEQAKILTLNQSIKNCCRDL